MFNNFFDVARARRREQRGGSFRAAASYYDAALPEVLSQKASFDSGCSSASRASGSSRGGALLVVRCSTRSASCSAILRESVCCAVVCGARALNFLCELPKI